MSFAEAHRRVGAGDRLPGESTDHASRQDADHWIRVYGELVRFKRGLLAVAENRHVLSIDASMEGAADEALIFGQMRRYERRLEEWQAARMTSTLPPSSGHGDGPVRLEGPVQRLGDLTVDHRNRVVVRDGRPIEMTPTEWKLFRVFLEHAGETLSRQQLAEWAWGSGFSSRAGEVEVYVSRLRRKLESPSSPNLIETVRGTGYRLAPPKDPRSAAAAPA
jgi:DNA-binding winged helix-turn-helix (wHTH) protein